MIRIFRIVMVLLCLGAASLAHASAHNNNLSQQLLPLTITHLSVATSLTQIPATVSLSTDTVTFATCNMGDSQNPFVTTHNQSSPQGHHVNLGLAYSSRVANLARHEPEDVFPEYELASEIPALPAEQLTIGYQEKPKPTVNWALHSHNTPSRLSSWKESNLLYSQRLFPNA